MNIPKTRLPRASTLAYKELRKRIPKGETQIVAESGGNGDQQQQLSSEIDNDPIDKAIMEAFELVKSHDALIQIEKLTLPAEIESWSAIVSALESKSITPRAALSKLRCLCSESLYTAFPIDRDASQAISNLLNDINKSVSRFADELDPKPVVPDPPKQQQPTEQHNDITTQLDEAPITLPPPIIPDETFFLPITSVKDILTIDADASLVRRQTASRQARRTNEINNQTAAAAATTTRGRGRGNQRGRGKGRGSGVGQKRPPPLPVWTLEVQQHLSIAFKIALGVPIDNSSLPTSNTNTITATTTTAIPPSSTSAPPLDLPGINNSNNNNADNATKKTLPSTSEQTNIGPDSLLKPVATFLDELKASNACNAFTSIGATLPILCAALNAGAYSKPEDMLFALEMESQDALEKHVSSQEKPESSGGGASAARRSKSAQRQTEGAIESLIFTVSALVTDLIGELQHMAKLARYNDMIANGLSAEVYAEEEARKQAEERARLPPCILANREPYRNGEWRKTPFAPRAYVRLQEYYIVEEETRASIQRKLTTAKRGGCDGTHCITRDQLGTYSLEHDGFQTGCTCLAKNTECDDSCGCASSGGGDNGNTNGNSLACLNRAITNRRTVVLGQDVAEINSWGMDCYTGRNILDAVLESQAFGEYKMPDYSSIIASKAASKDSSMQQCRGAATAAGQLAAVAADDENAEAAVAALRSTTSPPLGGNLDATVNDADGKKEGDGKGKDEEKGTNAAKSKAKGKKEEHALEKKEAEMKLELSKDDLKRRSTAVQHAAVTWIERSLIPAINRQENNGWNLGAALADVKARAIATDDITSLAAATAVEARYNLVGENYFRIHPKGVGLVCRRPGGLPRLTFIEEYLGEIYTPWRWFELQDAVKKITGDELPDFYNIVLERPKDDPAGYDVLFIDAAAKGAFASRMSHSCTPNCQAVVMACGGRLTIALYTMRHVQEGEELTFDYSSVTESEKEFREAICLCGTHMCRGSYLYFSGSRAFMQVLSQKHNILHRQVILLRAGLEPLTDVDRERLRRHGLGESCLGSHELGDRVPQWLEKWTSLICEYLDLEEELLPRELMEQDPLRSHTPATAAAEAKGVVANRLQNVVITLDKVRTFLAQPGQPQEPCLTPLGDKEIADHLWNGDRAVAKRFLRGAVHALVPSGSIRGISAVTQSDADFEIALVASSDRLPQDIQRLIDIILTQQAADADDARAKLLHLSSVFREMDIARGGGFTAAADVCLLYAFTRMWFRYERGYKSYQSPKVPINLQDLFLNREETQQHVSVVENDNTLAVARDGSVDAGGAMMDQATETKDSCQIEAVMKDAAAAAAAEARARHAEKAAASLARQHAKNPALRKAYRPLYCWGQLSGWFKQTVNDPTASLSAERRGTVSLPDVESCFAGRYGARTRGEMVKQMESRPDSMWKTGTQWTFRNDAKVYGSPAIDAAYIDSVGEEKAGFENSLKLVLKELKKAKLPFDGEYTLGKNVKKSRLSNAGGSSARGEKPRRRSSKRARDESDDDDDDLSGIDFSMI